MKVLILGAQGMLGHDLVKVFSTFAKATVDLHLRWISRRLTLKSGKKNYTVYAWGRKDLDIMNKKIVQEKITKLKPGIVINAAAYTDVDGCETNKKLCLKVNGYGVGYIALACLRCKAILVHYSTDYVFDGKKKEGYNEEDKPNPISVYGQSKVLGERELLKNTDKYYLIRSSWLYGPSTGSLRSEPSGSKTGFKNFVDTMLNLAKERDKIEVVNDQFGKPTYTKDLAQRTKEIIEQKKPFGIYHVVNEGVTSWYNFARKIFELAKVKVKVVPVTSGQFPCPAKRPKYSALINTKLPKMRGFKEALKEYLKDR